MKKLILIAIFLTNFALAGVFEESFKIYNKDADELYMSTLSAINQSGKFEVVETQSKNGYILFLYGSRYYLATITKRYQNQTEIKIMPQNSDYSQGSIVARAVFAILDKQLSSQPMEQIK